MRTLFLSALLVMLGAGCASAPPKEAAPLQGVAPHANETNCTKSGGAIVDGDCQCPEKYAPDPAG